MAKFRVFKNAVECKLKNRRVAVEEIGDNNTNDIGLHFTILDLEKTNKTTAHIEVQKGVVTHTRIRLTNEAAIALYSSLRIYFTNVQLKKLQDGINTGQDEIASR